VPIKSPPHFVSGAAAGIMSYIFNTPIHTYTIDARRQDFQRLAGRSEGIDWQAGVEFSKLPVFQNYWDWTQIRLRVLPNLSTYIPRARGSTISTPSIQVKASTVQHGARTLRW
jgi:hypothetical protein